MTRNINLSVSGYLFCLLDICRFRVRNQRQDQQKGFTYWRVVGSTTERPDLLVSGAAVSATKAAQRLMSPTCSRCGPTVLPRSSSNNSSWGSESGGITAFGELLAFVE